MALDGHEDIVMDVLHLPYLDNVASASLDRTIRVWDPYTEMEATRLVGHSKGVNSLTYNPEHRFLVSAGFDHDAHVWSPFVQTLLYKLKGHKAALIGCHAVEGTQELLTADTSGTFKLWDLRTFGCLDTFTSAHDPGDLDDLGGFQAFTHCKLPPKDEHQDRLDYRVVACTKKLFFFDQHRTKNEPISDDLPLRLIIINSSNLTVLVASERAVKIWDAILGTKKRTYEKIAPHDITAICLDDRKRKFFLGTSKGHVSCHNYANGAKMKRFQVFGGKARVVALHYVHGAKAILCARASGKVILYDEADIECCTVLRQFDDAYAHRHELLHCALHEGAGAAATMSAAAVEGIRLWDSDSAKCSAVVKTRGRDGGVEAGSRRRRGRDV